MTLFLLGRVSAIAAVGLLLAGCGGSSPGQSSIPQTPSAYRAVGQHGKSKSGDLIYATGGCDGTCVLTYPGLDLLGSIPDGGIAICSDSQGNVFMPNDTHVTEYAHGGTKPVKTLTLPGNLAAGCAVDPVTNNLAVVYESDVAIFPNERETPISYPTGIEALYCTYDQGGNLFVDGRNGQSPALAELPSGASDFLALSINGSLGNPGQLQWDGQYIAYQSFSKYSQVSQLQISGSSAIVVGTTTLKGIKHRVAQSWIYSGAIIVPYNIRGMRANVVGIWRYPRGGKLVKNIRKFDSYKKRTITFHGVAVSVQPDLERHASRLTAEGNKQ